jgi:rhomboid protease GluP
MDWSLALASEGIEPVIDFNQEAGWGLLVLAGDAERARDIIRQYRLENLRWLWRRPIFSSRLVFDWGSLVWVALLLTFFWLSESRAAFRSWGQLDSGEVGRGEWWRLFTAVQLHANFTHLADNAVIGFVLLGLAMGRYGTGLGLLVAYLAGVAGNLASWQTHPVLHLSLGASGMVMGALGMLAAQSVALRHELPNARRHIVGGIAGGIMLFVWFGLAPGSDVVAHLGGFFTGLLGGTAMAFAPRLARRPWVNLVTALLWVALVLWTWALALRASA